TFPVQDEFSTYAALSKNVFAYRWIIVTAAVVGWVLSLVLALYLLVVSGKRPDTDAIALTLYDRIPFDLLLCAVAAAVICGIGFGASFAFHMYHGASNTYRLLLLASGTLLMSGSAWLSMLTFASLVTRARAHTLLSNNILVRFGSRIWRFCKRHLGWMTSKLCGAASKLRDVGKYSAHYIAAGGAARIGLFIVLGALLVSVILSFLFAVMWQEQGVFVWSLFLLIFWAGGVLVALGQMVTLDKGAKQMAAGDLQHKIETEKLWIGFKGHAESLNAIADGMNAAVEHRMKSERLKTELLTNVSHDIKTPLTSIINYVDLLRAAEDDEHAQEYLEVLDRQSKRLKKLLEDLLEASKASTGNIRAELVPTDVSELLRQAAGEYEERLTAAQLTPVITLPAGKTTVLADGRLLWRIFDNMLNNIVKYSLPGTRVYLAVENSGDDWRVTFKNISREPLNIAADELMERFVRGDASRATEGNGLGLSIAQSLADCMNADFALSIDGDLFRASVTLKKYME
ncbi:MAG: HAMP domain-containing histidine kinase, partial [Oscillospiraceae bacterium]|nr:HAMP domain-containing histidine kinase [Oscillospiraceae bacterium]